MAVAGSIALIGGAGIALGVADANAATGSTLTVTPSTLVEQSTGNTLAFTFTIPETTTAGKLSIPLSGFPKLGTISVASSTCTTATATGGGGVITAKFNCQSGGSFTVDDTNQQAPKTAGTYTFLASTNATAITTYPSITVTSGAATHLKLTGLGQANDSDVAKTVLVTAFDSGNNIATGYTGTVNFTSTDGRATLPAPYTFQSSDNGQHSFSVQFYGPGRETLYVQDNSTPQLVASASTSVAKPSSIAVTPAGASVGIGGTQAFSAAVTFPDGTVVSPDTNVIWSTSTPSVATVSKTGVATGQSAGTDTIFATLAGTVGSTGLTVTQTTPEVMISSSANPASPGQSVTFTATVTGSNNPSGTVTFSDNGTQIGSPVALSDGSASIDDSSLPLGDSTVTASYSGDANNTSGTASLTQTVTDQTTTAVTSSENPSVYGDSVTFTATVSPVAGTEVPAGTVTFTDDNGDDSTVDLSGGTATFSTSSLPAGDTTVTATYTPADDSTATSSGSVTQEVDSPTTTAVTSDNNPAAAGTNADYTATVTPTDSTTAPSGTVSFYAFDSSNNPTYLGSATLSDNGNGTSSGTVTQDYPGSGTYTIVAVYDASPGSFDIGSGNGLIQTFQSSPS